MNNVEHPEHYNGKIECIDAIDSVVENMNGIGAFYAGQVIKYIWRFNKKNGLEDLLKAEWYLKRLIKKEKKKGNK